MLLLLFLLLLLIIINCVSAGISSVSPSATKTTFDDDYVNDAG